MAAKREVTFTVRHVYNTDPGAPSRAELLAEVWERAIQAGKAERAAQLVRENQPLTTDAPTLAGKGA